MTVRSSRKQVRYSADFDLHHSTTVPTTVNISKGRENNRQITMSAEEAAGRRQEEAEG